MDIGRHRGQISEGEVTNMTHAADSLADAIKRLKESPKFLEWGKVPVRNDGIDVSCLMKDKHYSPDELATLWGVSVDSIRRIFRDEPGVLKMGEKSPKHKRQYLTLRIPESVAERVHTRLSE
jgi:hypothetical protein